MEKENAEAGENGDEKQQGTKAGRKEKKHCERVPRFIYDEFKSINQHKKKMMKLSERNLRSAETEIGFWKKKAERKVKKAEKHIKSEKEQKIFGGVSAKDYLQQIEQRIPEVMQKIGMYQHYHRVSSVGAGSCCCLVQCYSCLSLHVCIKNLTRCC